MTERLAVTTWLLAIALFPAGRLAELPMLAAALAGLWLAVRGRIDLGAWPVRAASVVFAAYWLPELASAFDSVMPARSWREVAVDLRYLPMLVFWATGIRSEASRRLALTGVAAVALLWLMDGLLQATTGWSLGGPIEADRLSGLFGAEDLKLGPALAVLAPFVLAWQRTHTAVWRALTAVGLLTIVLLAGTRSAWITLLVGLGVLAWQWWGPKRAALAVTSSLVCMIAMGSVAWMYSDSFAARMDRTWHALRGDRAALDHALAGRLPIWSTALAMTAEHPLNGVGVRAFRHAYASHADTDDPWIEFQPEGGAAHAHQIVLEVLSETGAVGLACWLAALTWLVRSRPRGDVRQDPAAAALIAMLFPLNTHYAFFSSAWGGFMLCLVAFWLSQQVVRHTTMPHPAPDDA